MGSSVFCDWIAAPEAHRDAVIPANAALIRAVMATSASLVFLDTEGAAQSLREPTDSGDLLRLNARVPEFAVLKTVLIRFLERC